MNYSSLFITSAILMLVLILHTGCANDPSSLPEHVRNSKNLVVLTDHNPTTYSFELEKEVVFDDSLLIERIHDITTDSNGRLYIAGESWGKRQVHIFQSDGSYLDSLGVLGTDLGEFQSIDNIQIQNDQLLLFDRKLQRLTSYNLSDRSFSDTLGFNRSIDMEEGKNNSLNFRSEPVARIDNANYLMKFRQIRNPAYEPNGILYFIRMNRYGENQQKVAEFPDVSYVVGDYAGSPAAFSLPLPDQTIYHISSSNKLFAAHTAEFFIRSFSVEDVSEKNSYYFPTDRFLLNPDEINHPRFSHNRQLLKVRESANYPEYWPLLYSIVTDDLNRIWVSKILEDRENLEWWIIDDNNQEVIGRIVLPISKNIAHIKNNEVYTIENDDMGFKKVVRYRLK
ncbi:MAG: 6-bladed beta-propeller [Balneolaceae bacterium]|nr:6-bladed beta-propeller [Balneolaceae bacterium]